MRRAVVCALLAIASRAYADDDLAEARRLEAALEYEKALAVVDRVIARGGANPQQLVELHLFAGRLAAGLDRAPLAEDHFARVLALLPTATLPAGTSPKLTVPFEAARARARPLVVSPNVTHGLVTLDPELDALGLVKGVAVHVVEGGVHRDIVERNALRIVVPDSATIVEISALDADGNRLWIGHPPAASEPPPKIVVPVVVHHGTPFYARWSTYAIATGVVAAGAGVCVWRLEVAQNDFDELKQGPHDYSKLKSVADRGQQWALAANIGFGVAGAALLTTAIVALVHHGDDEPPVMIAPTPTGATAVLRF